MNLLERGKLILPTSLFIGISLLGIRTTIKKHSHKKLTHKKNYLNVTLYWSFTYHTFHSQYMMSLYIALGDHNTISNLDIWFDYIHNYIHNVFHEYLLKTLN